MGLGSSESGVDGEDVVGGGWRGGVLREGFSVRVRRDICK